MGGGKRTRALSVILVIVLAMAVQWSQRSLDRFRTIRFVDPNPIFLPKGEVLKALSTGHRGMVADWLWIRCVLYYGRRVMDEDNPYYRFSSSRGNLEKEMAGVRKMERGPVDSSRPQNPWILNTGRMSTLGLVDDLYPLLDRVTTVDPHFLFPYLFGGVYVFLDTGEYTSASNLLEKGYRANPERWEFPFYLGWIAWMDREDSVAVLRYLSEAVTKTGCPVYAADLLAGLSKRLDRSAFTKMYLERLYQSVDNAEIRKQVQEFMDRL
jgi:hypothetical protein